MTVAGAPASLPMAGLRLDDPALANLRFDLSPLVLWLLMDVAVFC